MKNRKRRRADAAKAQKVTDPFKVYMNAERFRIADMLLRQASSTPDVAAAIGGPTLVMAAFASELYLKCLYAFETGRPATGHELRTLFLMLSDKIRAEIEARWDEYTAHPQRVRVYEAIERLEGISIPRDLRWSLKNGNDAFVSLRYIHEPDYVGPKFFLGNFHNLLRDVILVRHPQWGHLGHGPMREIPMVGESAATATKVDN
jgi:hypothetical protein